MNGPGRHLDLSSELCASQFGNEPKPQMAFLSILLGKVQVALKLVLA